MSYVKQTWDDKTWAKGQKYFQDALNHMETGIEQGGGGSATASYIELEGWSESGWTPGGTLTDAQAAVLTSSELNYIWMNEMHRLDFRYKQTSNNLATYSSNDGEKCHVIEVTLSDKTWRYKHELLQPKLTAGININISNNNVITATNGQGKYWTEINLSASDILTMARGGQIVKNLSTAYDPTNFKSDYFLTKVEQTGVDYGKMVYPSESMTNVRVALDSFTNVSTYLAKSLSYLLDEYGFDHNYYKTAIIFAGTTDTTDYILRGNGIVDGPNVVYVQDVTQQWWESNIEDEESGKYATVAREKMEHEEYGGAYVFHFKGATDEMNFLYCMYNSQASYWDNTTNRTKWANIEAGKFYQVTFDGTGAGTHNTQRWLVTPTTVGEEIYATEVTSSQKTAWLNTGINFGSNIYAANAYDDTSMKAANKVIGWFEEWLSRIITFNDPFGEAQTSHLEYIGRPVGYMLDTVTYTKSEEVHVEKDGEHLWTCDVQGVEIQLIIPDNNDAQGVPHRDTYIMQFNMKKMTSTASLYRHTFTVRPYDEATFTSGETVARVCFCAVNAQAGDSSVDYLLNSDKVGQEADWILPASGVVGIATGSGQAVTAWYPALRVVAGWKEVEGDHPVRCLYLNYFDTSANEMKKVEFLTYSNADKWQIGDLRSDLLTVTTPYYGKY